MMLESNIFSKLEAFRLLTAVIRLTFIFHYLAAHINAQKKNLLEERFDSGNLSPYYNELCYLLSARTTFKPFYSKIYL